MAASTSSSGPSRISPFWAPLTALHRLEPGSTTLSPFLPWLRATYTRHAPSARRILFDRRRRSHRSITPPGSSACSRAPTRQTWAAVVSETPGDSFSTKISDGPQAPFFHGVTRTAGAGPPSSPDEWPASSLGVVAPLRISATTVGSPASPAPSSSCRIGIPSAPLSRPTSPPEMPPGSAPGAGPVATSATVTIITDSSPIIPERATPW